MRSVSILSIHCTCLHHTSQEIQKKKSIFWQAGGVNRELSFASSSFAPEAMTQQENGGGQVQHVASLGSWLKQGQDNADTTRRPSVKLSGEFTTASMLGSWYC